MNDISHIIQHAEKFSEVREIIKATRTTMDWKDLKLKTTKSQDWSGIELYEGLIYIWNENEKVKTDFPACRCLPLPSILILLLNYSLLMIENKSLRIIESII
jgi:hypothetical protein